MRLVVTGIVLLLLGSAGAEASLFNRSKLPKPIDHPIVRPKVREDHKVGKCAGRHPSEFIRPDWGTEWNHTLYSRQGPHQIPEYLKQVE